MKYTRGPYKPGPTTNIGYTVAAAPLAAAISVGVEVVRVVCSTDAFVSFGSAPVASASTDYFMEAKKPEYFIIPPGGTTKFSAIRSAVDGTLYVTEMT